MHGICEICTKYWPDKPEEKRLVAQLRHEWEDNIKMYCKET
jgi:hypothetical protein